MDQKICVVTATREKTIEDFKRNTLLGKSLEIKTFFDIELVCFVNNTDGLSKCYNEAINQLKNTDKILVFVHDDVALLDYYWPLRTIEVLKNYDFAGVAGNVRHQINYPGWAHSLVENGSLIWDFDERFKFHFYDADFCKSAVNKKCKLGTFPLALLHAGKGNMNSPEYIDGYKEFYRKWNDELSNNR